MQSIVFNEDSFHDLASKQKTKDIVDNDNVLLSKQSI